MEVQSGKYQKCIDENGREYLFKQRDNTNGRDIRLYFTGQENPQTFIMLKDIIAKQLSKLTSEMPKGSTSRNTSV